MPRYICTKDCRIEGLNCRKNGIYVLRAAAAPTNFQDYAGDVRTPANLKVAKDMDGTLYMGVPGWEHVRFPANGLKSPGNYTAPDVDPEDGGLLFAPGTVELTAGMAVYPASMKLDGLLESVVHWVPTTTDVGDVVWRVDFSPANIGGVFPAFQSLDIIGTAGGTADQHIASYLGVTRRLTNKFGSLIKGRISRVGDDVRDTYPADAKFLEYDMIFEMDSWGSGSSRAK